MQKDSELKSELSSSALFGKCVRCASFRNSNKRGYGYCCGNTAAYKAMTGKSFSRGAPEGPSFRVRKLDGCKHWQSAWTLPNTELSDSHPL